jgi:hypothetical protein
MVLYSFGIQNRSVMFSILFQTVCQSPSARRERYSSAECELYFDAKWEIPTENLIIGAVLGEGAFGIVRKGVLHTGEKRRDVAVKMLRGINRTCSEAFRQLLLT